MVKPIEAKALEAVELILAMKNTIALREKQLEDLSATIDELEGKNNKLLEENKSLAEKLIKDSESKDEEIEIIPEEEYEPKKFSRKKTMKAGTKSEGNL